MPPGHRPRRAVEIRNPDLRPIFFSRNKRKPFPVRRPARTVGILIRNNFFLFALSTLCHPERSRGTCCRLKRHYPHMRRLRIRLQIDIHRGKQHPLPIRRHLWLLDALQRHHVFKSERMLSLSDQGQRRNENRQEEKTSAHNDLRREAGTRPASLIHPWIHKANYAASKPAVLRMANIALLALAMAAI